MIELEEMIRDGFLSQMNGIFTALPCVVVGTSQIGESRIDVQPSIVRKYKDDTTEEYPSIIGVPVVFPSSSTSALTFPISVGDTVLCVFSQRGMDTFKAGKSSSAEPTDFRKFDKRDAIAIPGLFPFSKSVNSPNNRSLPHSTSDAVISHNLGSGNEVEVRLKSDGGVLIKSPSTVTIECVDSVVTASSSLTVNIPSSDWTGNINYTGDMIYNGNMTINGILVVDGVNMNTHVHGGVTPGAGFTSVPE